LVTTAQITFSKELGFFCREQRLKHSTPLLGVKMESNCPGESRKGFNISAHMNFSKAQAHCSENGQKHSRPPKPNLDTNKHHCSLPGGWMQQVCAGKLRLLAAIRHDASIDSG
jgi:hypothetical protein